MREWRQGHPKRYHPAPSVASHITARSGATRSVAPSLASRLREPSVAAAEPHRSNAGSQPSRRFASSHPKNPQQASPVEQQLLGGGSPVHTLKQKRHNQKTVDELLAENQAYDETIAFLNERRSMCEKVKRGTDTEAGRKAIADLMKKSNAPFALITEPIDHVPSQQSSAFVAKNR